MNAPLAFVREIDSTIAQSTPDRRGEIVRHLTDLMLVNAEQYSDDEMELIDDLFVRLVATIEESARALLAIRLGPYAKAPPKILGILACDDVIDVASPILSQSEQLSDATLIRCAKTKSQEHLLAISRRKSLTEALTDVLVERGDQQVVLSTAQNAGAKFSSGGFKILVNRANGDDRLTECIGLRPDFPPQLFDPLFEAASKMVRRKLEAESPHARHHVHSAVEDATDKIRAQIVSQAAQNAAIAWKKDVEKLETLAKTNQAAETIALLARMSGMPVEFVKRKIEEDHVESLLILAAAIGLAWDTTKIVLFFSAGPKSRSIGDIEKCEIAYQRLNQPTAQKILGFHRMRERPAGKLH
jgi:uncharacterized protein (DUF2336 family)